MGQAKKKAALRAAQMDQTKPMKAARFDVLTIGTRGPATRYMAEELSYWTDTDERVIGLVFRDRTDDDFGWVVMARDAAGRFRGVNVEASLRSLDYATVGLRVAMAEALALPVDHIGIQGDEPAVAIDLLTVASDVPGSKLHPYFKELVESPGRQPARSIIREIGPWLDPQDPHLIKEFQQHQFDQRLWELYLWAAFRELGMKVEHREAPDFVCQSIHQEFSVEATTVAPSTMGPLASHPNPKTRKEMEEFLNNYMPLKYGSSLKTKLEKKNADGQRYWEREDTRGKPFLLAIADFHKAATEEEMGSMTYTQSSIWQYLYGTRVDWSVMEGRLVLTPTKVTSHAYNGKTAPSGFFDLAEAVNVSAVLFSNAGTIAKFDRMGVLAGFGAVDHKYFRFGMHPDPDPNSPVGIPFSLEVTAEDEYEELWSDELQVFHNPNAKYPLDRRVFGGIAQHWFEDGDLRSIVPPHHVLSSFTAIFHVTDGGDFRGPVEDSS